MNNKMYKNSGYLIWNYFEKNPDQKLAKCKQCNNSYSYKTSVTNLKQHLRFKHKNLYQDYISKWPRASAIADIEEDEDDNETRNEIWNYFEEEGKRARCSVCRELLSDTSYDNLKDHLFTDHPTVLLHFEQEQDNTEENHLKLNSDDDDDDNNFTEVVYLEPETTPEEPRKRKPRINNTYSIKHAKKRVRNHSSDEQHLFTLKKYKGLGYPKEEEEETELNTFIKYVRCLLKKMTPDMFTKVQVDILKVVTDGLAADKVAAQDTSGTKSGILTDVGNNSLRNVIKIDEMSTENVSNFTMKLLDNNVSTNKNDVDDNCD